MFFFTDLMTSFYTFLAVFYNAFETFSIDFIEKYFFINKNIFYILLSYFLLRYALIFFFFDSNVLMIMLSVNYLHNSFKFIFNLIVNYVKYKLNLFYYFISYIFFSIFFNNVIGLLPFSNTINSHLNITIILSFICWFGILLIGFNNFGSHFISLFCVSGIPYLLVPFLGCIEVLSYFFRFISLSLRLFANIVAGHVLLETIYVFTFFFILNYYSITFFNFILFLLPVSFLIILILFETVISFLQAYIFVVLSLIYLKDSLYLH